MKLNYHVKCCNQIAVLCSENYLEDVKAVISDYFQHNITIRDSDVNSPPFAFHLRKRLTKVREWKQVTLPSLFKQYKKDFPSNKEELFTWIANFLVEPDKQKLEELVKAKVNSIKIRHSSSDITPTPLTKLKFTRVILEEDIEEGKEEGKEEQEDEFKDVQLQV